MDVPSDPFPDDSRAVAHQPPDPHGDHAMPDYDGPIAFLNHDCASHRPPYDGDTCTKRDNEADEQPVTVDQLLDARALAINGDPDGSTYWHTIRARASQAAWESHLRVNSALAEHDRLTPAERAIFEARIHRG